MLAARQFTVSGRVQGVGFRFFVADAARREGLSGWVRNLPDGRVEALAEGEPEALDRLEAQLRRGPASARVVRVLSETLEPGGHAGEFEIR